MDDNPNNCRGYQVRPITKLIKYNLNSLVLIATTDKVQKEIMIKLKRHNFPFVSISSESQEMENLCIDYIAHFFRKQGRKYIFLENEQSNSKKNITIFMVKNHNDKKTMMPYELPDYMTPLQVGKYFTKINLEGEKDNSGENISFKNKEYCELTGTFWIWKNLEKIKSKYVGLCHYRRWFDFRKIQQFINDDIDVILTTPIVNLPNVVTIYEEDHEKEDWLVMMEVLKKLEPNYYQTAIKYFSGTFYYGYNMIIAKKRIFNEYCEWLFPILYETELRCKGKDSIYQNRYIGFLGEHLTGLFFWHNFEKYKIVHSKRIFLK
ncbi:MAG: DUF4422 domain-containing protein [Liquorilactobacillus sp.]